MRYASASKWREQELGREAWKDGYKKTEREK